jgi:hypothetical protein
MTDQSTSTTPKASRRASLSPMNPLVLIALMALISAASIALYDRWRYQPVMSVDIERIMQTRMDTIKGMMTEENSRELIIKRSVEWSSDLAKAIEDLEREYHAVVLARPAVVGGAIDMTDYVEARIQK